MRCGTEEAFDLFTQGMAGWWPLETHSRAASEFDGEGVRSVGLSFEPRVGGTLVERLSNGLELPWGEVLVWEPPSRFVLAWKPHGRDEPPTELEVSFSERGDETLVELEHRAWERLAKPEAYESYSDGWGLTLDRFASMVAPR
ncbi:MAG TPA: SRPBCC domain-containing protein [Actinomycetota bacterium]|nr:SRPBCC domain-containing protein [Actinomycetota bacterium]